MTSLAGSSVSDASRISVSGTQVTSGLPSGSVDSPEARKLRKAAGDFESILLASMWKSMKQSFGTSESDDADPAHGTLDDWGIEIMSSEVGKAGGLGIGKMILKHLQPQVEAEASDNFSQFAKVPGGFRR
jgi:Rod binding domain-containing protein